MDKFSRDTDEQIEDSTPVLYFDGWNDFVAHLDKLGLFRMEPGLDRIHKVLEYLGLARPPYVVVQVVGTNGKGSTSSFLASLAQAHGFKTGLHTSPHFVSCRERIHLFYPDAPTGGEFLSEKELLTSANMVMAAVIACGVELSWFELLTATAVQAFALARVEIAVMESGLGGLFDATTAIDADYLVYTPIAMDHCNILGDTIAKIARDKAGAISPGINPSRSVRAVFSACQQPEALAELGKAAEAKNIPLYSLPGDPKEYKALLPSKINSGEIKMRLGSSYQFANAALALQSWRKISQIERLCTWMQAESEGQNNQVNLRTEFEEKALALAWIPGRMQKIPARTGYPFAHPPLLLDGAHNLHGFSALTKGISEEGLTPAAIIFSCLADKEPEAIIPLLLSFGDCPIFIPPISENPRAMPAKELVELIGPRAEPAASMEEALQKATSYIYRKIPELFNGNKDETENFKSPLLICGSLYLLGEFFFMAPEYLNPSN